MKLAMLCECGCGGLAPLARDTDSRHGWVKGQPKRFIAGHNFKTDESRTRSAELARSLGKSRTGSKNHMWKGDAAGYDSIHDWINRHYPRTGLCEECGEMGKTEWSNKDHAYRRVREDWRELCIRCHRKADGWREMMSAIRREKANG